MSSFMHPGVVSKKINNISNTCSIIFLRMKRRRRGKGPKFIYNSKQTIFRLIRVLKYFWLVFQYKKASNEPIYQINDSFIHCFFFLNFFRLLFLILFYVNNRFSDDFLIFPFNINYYENNNIKLSWWMMVITGSLV